MDLSDDNVVVGEGRWQTQEPKALVNGLPLGPKAVKVFLDVVHEPETFLWRPTLEVAYLEDSVMTFISWPAHKVVFENPVEARRKVSPTPNTAGLKVPSPGSTGSSLKKNGKSRATTSTTPTTKSSSMPVTLYSLGFPLILFVLLSEYYNVLYCKHDS